MKINEIYTPFDDININTYLEKNGINNPNEYLKPTKNNFETWRSYVGSFNPLITMDWIDEANKIYILQDNDVDGICSSAIIYDALKSLFKITPIMLYHTDKRHGVNEEIINQIDDNSLLIIPDASVNNLDMAIILNNKNIQVITLDHHDIFIEYPNIITINNQYSNAQNKALSGAGVTHKFVEWLYYTMKCYNQDRYYDLVALSIISDSCDIKSIENRAYIYYTFETNILKNQFLRYLCDTLIKGDITPHELSFKVINLLNAVCRSDNQELKNKLFRCFVEEYNNYDEVLLECKNIKKLQDEKVNYILDNTDIINSDNLVVMITEDIQGLSGLVGNKLQSKYLKPAFVVHEEDGEYIGSVRSPIGIRELVADNELFTFNQGHSAAYGTSFPKNNLDNIIKYFSNLDLRNSQEYKVLGSYTKNIPNKLFTEFADYEILWSQGLSKPMIHYHFICNGADWVSLRGATIKIIYNDITFIKFFVSNKQKEQWHIGENNMFSVDIIGSCNINNYNGKTSNQVIIENMEISQIA